MFFNLEQSQKMCVCDTYFLYFYYIEIEKI